jgi:hypothetical protein
VCPEEKAGLWPNSVGPEKIRDWGFQEPPVVPTVTTHPQPKLSPPAKMPWRGAEDRIFGDWMPAHPHYPMASVTHMTICDQAHARWVRASVLGAPSPGAGGPLQVGTGRGAGQPSLSLRCPKLGQVSGQAGMDLPAPGPEPSGLH